MYVSLLSRLIFYLSCPGCILRYYICKAQKFIRAEILFEISTATVVRCDSTELAIKKLSVPFDSHSAKRRESFSNDSRQQSAKDGFCEARTHARTHAPLASCDAVREREIRGLWLIRDEYNIYFSKILSKERERANIYIYAMISEIIYTQNSVLLQASNVFFYFF
jgi:hypothetical protein